VVVNVIKVIVVVVNVVVVNVMEVIVTNEHYGIEQLFLDFSVVFDVIIHDYVIWFMFYFNY